MSGYTLGIGGFSWSTYGWRPGPGLYFVFRPFFYFRNFGVLDLRSFSEVLPPSHQDIYIVSELAGAGVYYLNIIVWSSRRRCIYVVTSRL